MSSLYPPHQPYNAPSHKPTYSYKRSAIPSSPYLLRFKKKHVPMVSFGWPWPARAAHCLERQQKSLVPTRSDGWGRIRKCRPRGIEIWEFGVPNLSAAASLALESLAGAICCLWGESKILVWLVLMRWELQYLFSGGVWFSKPCLGNLYQPTSTISISKIQLKHEKKWPTNSASHPWSKIDIHGNCV